MNDRLGKDAEKKIKIWLDQPEAGYSLDRIPDQMTGFYGVSRNICDFVCYKQPYIYYIESKATWSDRFDLAMIQPHQEEGLLKKSKIPGCFGWVIILFASYKRAFKLDIQDIVTLKSGGQKSLNIKKINKWPIAYKEIHTIPNSRKQLLDYDSKIEDLL